MEIAESADLFMVIYCNECGVKIQTPKEGLPDIATQKQESLDALLSIYQTMETVPPDVVQEFNNETYELQESYALPEFDQMQDLCRGQGTCYTAQTDAFIPNYQTHYVFAGNYSGYCCYCAVIFKDWDLNSFKDTGCYLCKESLLKCMAFQNIHRSTTFWRNMPETVFNLIMRFLVGREQRKTILMHA